MDPVTLAALAQAAVCAMQAYQAYCKVANLNEEQQAKLLKETKERLAAFNISELKKVWEG